MTKYYSMGQSKSIGLSACSNMSKSAQASAISQFLIDRLSHSSQDAEILANIFDSLEEGTASTGDLSRLNDLFFTSPLGNIVDFDVIAVSPTAHQLSIYNGNVASSYQVDHVSSSNSWKIVDPSGTFSDSAAGVVDYVEAANTNLVDKYTFMANMLNSVRVGNASALSALLSVGILSENAEIQELSTALSGVSSTDSFDVALAWIKDNLVKSASSIATAAESNPDAPSFDLIDYNSAKTLSFNDGVWDIVSGVATAAFSILMVVGGTVLKVVGAIGTAAISIANYFIKKKDEGESYTLGNGTDYTFANGLRISIEHGGSAPKNFGTDTTYGRWLHTTSSTINPAGYSECSNGIFFPSALGYVWPFTLNTTPATASQIFDDLVIKYQNVGCYTIPGVRKWWDSTPSKYGSMYDHSHIAITGAYRSTEIPGYSDTLPSGTINDGDGWYDNYTPYTAEQQEKLPFSLSNFGFSSLTSSDLRARLTILQNYLAGLWDFANKINGYALPKGFLTILPQRSWKLWPVEDGVTNPGFNCFFDDLRIIGNFVTKEAGLSDISLNNDAAFNVFICLLWAYLCFGAVDDIALWNSQHVGTYADLHVPDWTDINGMMDRILELPYDSSVNLASVMSGRIPNWVHPNLMLMMMQLMNMWMLGVIPDNFDWSHSTVHDLPADVQYCLTCDMANNAFMTTKLAKENLSPGYVPGTQQSLWQPTYYLNQAQDCYLYSVDRTTYDSPTLPNDPLITPPKYTQGSTLAAVLTTVAVVASVAAICFAAKKGWNSFRRKLVLKKEATAIAAQSAYNDAIASPDNYSKEEITQLGNDYAKAQRKFQRIAGRLGYSSNNIGSFSNRATSTSTIAESFLNSDATPYASAADVLTNRANIGTLYEVMTGNASITEGVASIASNALTKEDVEDAMTSDVSLILERINHLIRLVSGSTLS